MKRENYIYGIVILIFACTSCSDDFLSRNDAAWYDPTDTLFLSNYDDNVATSFELQNNINADFTLYMHPRWIAFASPHGRVNNGTVPLAFSIDENYVPSVGSSYVGTVVLDIEDYGFVALTVIFTNFGYPSIQCSPAEVVFDRTYFQEITLLTSTEGILAWEIEDIPDWLTFSQTSGTLWYPNYTWVTITLDPAKITPLTEMVDSVRITGNSVTGDFLLMVRVTPWTVPPAQGTTANSILTDAEYHHESGVMAICTKSPNQLLLLNTASGVTDTIKLEKTPNCISFSEDGQKAVLGYSVASVAYIDIATLNITAEYSIDCIPYDIVLGENGWCYITPVEDQGEMLRNLNLNTGQLITSSTADQIYEKTVIRKVPGKPLMAGSMVTLSPTSLLLFDLTVGQANDKVSRYHEPIGDFWLSKDGARLYAAYGNVYSVPEYDGQIHSSSPPVYGNIDTELSYIYALDDCPAINSVFASSSNYWFQTGTSSLIEQFNATNLNKIKTFNVSPVWLNLTGTFILFETSPRFIFVKKDGAAMYVVKTLRQEYGVEGWFMETIDL
ncbi:MAG: hypothetical protein U5L72_10060 [Bacteroidales bacterium]|nr:hypothetical protein [Bacteroidales bacterium]